MQNIKLSFRCGIRFAAHPHWIGHDLRTEFVETWDEGDHSANAIQFLEGLQHAHESPLARRFESAA